MKIVIYTFLMFILSFDKAYSQWNFYNAFLNPCSKVGSSCLDLYNKGCKIDGLYNINVFGQSEKVTCDMTNGGWTIFPITDGSQLLRGTPSTPAFTFRDELHDR